MDEGITIRFNKWALGRDPEALCPNTKSISKAFRSTCYYLMLKEFFTSSVQCNAMGKSSPPQKVSKFSESNCPVSEAKQNKTKTLK